jgi:hypothetical protein
MRKYTVPAIGALAWLAAISPASAEVQLTIQGGRVSLVAKDATLRQILAEWARVGQTKIVNAERVPGGPLTLQLTDVPEEQALDTLLRPLSGYVAAPRPSAVASLSRFDRILVMPSIAQPLPAAPAAATAQPPVFPQPNTAPAPSMAQQGPQAPAANADDLEDDRPVPNAGRAPVFNTFPQPQVVSPAPQGVPSATPGLVPPPPPQAAPPNVTGGVPPANATGAPAGPAPSPAYPGATSTPSGGVSVPGMIVAPPPQPGQPNNAQQPKRPGGGGRTD